MERRLLAIVLALVTFNFLFLTGFTHHVEIGLIWLLVDVVCWWPDLAKLRP